MDPADERTSVELTVTTAALMKAIGLLAIHFPEKFHVEPWRAMTVESMRRELGRPDRPIVLAQQRFDEPPSEVKAALRSKSPL